MHLATVTNCLFLKSFKLASLPLLIAKLHSRDVKYSGVVNFGKVTVKIVEAKSRNWCQTLCLQLHNPGVNLAISQTLLVTITFSDCAL